MTTRQSSWVGVASIRFDSIRLNHHYGKGGYRQESYTRTLGRKRSSRRTSIAAATTSKRFTTTASLLNVELTSATGNLLRGTARDRPCVGFHLGIAASFTLSGHTDPLFGVAKQTVAIGWLVTGLSVPHGFGTVSRFATKRETITIVIAKFIVPLARVALIEASILLASVSKAIGILSADRRLVNDKGTSAWIGETTTRSTLEIIHAGNFTFLPGLAGRGGGVAEAFVAIFVHRTGTAGFDLLLADAATASHRSAGTVEGTGLADIAHGIALTRAVTIQTRVRFVALKVGSTGKANRTVGRGDGRQQTEHDGCHDCREIRECTECHHRDGSFELFCFGLLCSVVAVVAVVLL